MLLLSLSEDDTMTCTLNRKGTYTIKSAYYHLMESITSNDHLKTLRNWTKLWKLRIRRKMKIFT
uniref:Uncharacterized protein n=1 Tax=Cajanus cajan TaxID=3821 RepID=A0A151QLT3_CAJCA|nr:hypothetical protein KK1_048575 [Cajanus cajan]